MVFPQVPLQGAPSNSGYAPPCPETGKACPRRWPKAGREPNEIALLERPKKFFAGPSSGRHADHFGKKRKERGVTENFSIDNDFRYRYTSFQRQGGSTQRAPQGQSERAHAMSLQGPKGSPLSSKDRPGSLPGPPFPNQPLDAQGRPRSEKVPVLPCVHMTKGGLFFPAHVSDKPGDLGKVALHFPFPRGKTGKSEISFSTFHEPVTWTTSPWISLPWSQTRTGFFSFFKKPLPTLPHRATVRPLLRPGLDRLPKARYGNFGNDVRPGPARA